MTVNDLIQALKDSGQPEARVVVEGQAAADNEEGYVSFELKVVNVHVGCCEVCLEVGRG